MDAGNDVGFRITPSFSAACWKIAFRAMAAKPPRREVRARTATG
jgi:hypothetical protein